MNLCFGARDELYLVNLDLVMYFQADDHYAYVFYTTGTKFLLPIGLSKIENTLAGQFPHRSPFLRLGRKYIVNIRCLFHINILKQTILLTDAHGNNHALHIAKPVLRDIISRLKEEPEEQA